MVFFELPFHRTVEQFHVGIRKSREWSIDRDRAFVRGGPCGNDMSGISGRGGSCGSFRKVLRLTRGDSWLPRPLD